MTATIDDSVASDEYSVNSDGDLDASNDDSVTSDDISTATDDHLVGAVNRSVDKVNYLVGSSD